MKKLICALTIVFHLIVGYTYGQIYSDIKDDRIYKNSFFQEQSNTFNNISEASQISMLSSNDISNDDDYAIPAWIISIFTLWLTLDFIASNVHNRVFPIASFILGQNVHMYKQTLFKWCLRFNTKLKLFIEDRDIGKICYYSKCGIYSRLLFFKVYLKDADMLFDNVEEAKAHIMKINAEYIDYLNSRIDKNTNSLKLQLNIN